MSTWGKKSTQQYNSTKLNTPQLNSTHHTTPLTDTHTVSDMNIIREKWDVCVQLIVKLVTSWTGLLFLAGDQLGLRTFVNALKLPHEELHVRFPTQISL